MIFFSKSAKTGFSLISLVDFLSSGLFYLLMIKVMRIEVGSYASNCYLTWDDETAEGVIIDPGADELLILNNLAKVGFKPLAILLTHAHSDHIGGVKMVKDKFDIPIYIASQEKEWLMNPELNLSAMSGTPVVAVEPDELLSDEQLLTFGKLNFKVLHTPGHSPGSVSFFNEERGMLFCGDALFAGSIGRTDFPGCSLEQLMDSITKKIMTLPDSVICFPGHGIHTTVGAERKNNPFINGSSFA